MYQYCGFRRRVLWWKVGNVRKDVLPPSTGRVLEAEHQLTRYHSPDNSIISTAMRTSDLIFINHRLIVQQNLHETKPFFWEANNFLHFLEVLCIVFYVTWRFIIFITKPTSRPCPDSVKCSRSRSQVFTFHFNIIPQSTPASHKQAFFRHGRFWGLTTVRGGARSLV
jgi:hypothetical protein